MCEYKNFYRYIYKGEVLRVGKTYKFDFLYQTFLGDIIIQDLVTIENEKTILELIERGIDIKKEFSTKEVLTKELEKNQININPIERPKTRLRKEIMDRIQTIPNDLSYYINLEREGMDDTYKWLKTYFPSALYDIYSKNIAEELDKAYSNNIRNCKELLVIESVSGKPFKINREEFTTEEWANLINNIAVFRNEVDLIVCQKLLKDFKKLVWLNKPKRHNE